MKIKLVIALTALSSLVLTHQSPAQGTAFTYQGRLNDGVSLANGIYDLRCALYDDATSGAQQGMPITNNACNVSNGLFTVTMDFGNQFSGANRWLELAVRTNGGGSFSALSPRQKFAATPYAITAGNLTGSLPAAQLSGTIAGGNLPASPSFSGTVAANFIAGNGANVTNVNAATLNGLTAANFWRTNGNAGANPTNGAFLGTTDNLPLEFRANNQRALRIEPNATSPNLIAGHSGNVVSNGFYGETLLGGGYSGAPNRVANYFATVVGGVGNTASGSYAIAMGEGNTASGYGSIAMGHNTSVSGSWSTAIGNGSVATGSYSTALGQSIANGDLATAIGDSAVASNTWAMAIGHQATATGYSSTAIGNNPQANGYGSMAIGAGAIADGVGSTAFGNGTYAYGYQSSSLGNTTETLGRYATAIGYNTHAEEEYSTAIGVANYASGTNSTAIGFSTHAIGDSATAMGRETGAIGVNSTAMGYLTGAGGDNSTAMGMRTVANGITATAMGYYTYANGDYSTAMGYYAQANQTGTFIWADQSSTNIFASTSTNQFLIRARGGVGINTNNPNGAALSVNGAIVASGTVTANGVLLTSDRNAKENFTAVDPRSMLAKVAALPITEWNYKNNDAGIHHVGPMAQDFQAAFQLSADDQHISVVDEGGVALAAIQGLNQKVEEKDAEIKELKQSVAELKALLQTFVEKK